MTLKIGSQGSDVGALQKALNENGANLNIDYDLGSATANAAISFAVSKLLPDRVVPIPTPQPEPQSRIHGIDIYDGDIVSDWSKLVPAGFLFCSIKTTQSNNLPQHRYAEHRAKAKANGLISGPYHFPNFDKSAKEQAEYFADYVNSHGGLSDEDLLPMLDWEYYPESRGVRYGDGEWALTFLQEIERRLKRISFIYSGYFTIMEAVSNEPGIEKHLSRYPFWMAWYTAENKIKTPSPWPHWHIWQYSGEALVPGYDRTQDGKGDADIFNGSLDDLKALIRASILP